MRENDSCPSYRPTAIRRAILILERHSYSRAVIALRFKPPCPSSSTTCCTATTAAAASNGRFAPLLCRVICCVRSPRSLSASLQETFADIKARRSAEGVARLEFNVLSEMATFVVEGPQCASLAALLVPYIRRKVRGGLPLTEMNRRSVLLTLSRLLPRVERPEQYTVDIGRQLLLNGRPETIAACVAAACALGPRFAKSSQLLSDMNAMNPKRLSEPVGRIIRAFSFILEPCECDML